MAILSPQIPRNNTEKKVAKKVAKWQAPPYKPLLTRGFTEKRLEKKWQISGK